MELNLTKMIKTAHESPKSIFNEVQSGTDIDYALVHLFEEDEEYYQLFVDALAKGREVILDNSIFELQEAFDAEKFNYWVNKLQPTWYIIPDALEEKERTIAQLNSWFEKGYGNPNCKTVGVVQGKTYNEIVECYNAIVDKVDMVAISFDYSFFEQVFPSEATKYHKWMKGRQWLIDALINDEVMREDKPHHLLGCGLPQEFHHYRDLPQIYSLDTSNPVVHGAKGILYEECEDQDRVFGLQNKESQPLFTMINEEISDKKLAQIHYNIVQFRTNLGEVNE